MTRVACIDIGTVTARLAVADVSGGRVTRMGKQSQICNLGEGVDATHRLSQGAMERVYAAAAAYVGAAAKAGCQGICCTLTSAARDAENSAELGAALASLGLEPMVIPGEVEGALTFLGVAQDFGGQKILVADNGGGSTELAMGSLNDGVLDLGFVRSVDVGCRRLTDKFFSASELPSQDDLAAAHEFAGSLFGPAVEQGCLHAATTGDDASSGGAPTRLVVCGGTVTTMVALNLALDPYDPSRVHLASLSRQQVEAIEEKLAGLTVEQRAELPGIQTKRAPVILGGVSAVLELMRQTGFDQLTVSESDLLFGLSLAAAATLEGQPSPVVWKPVMRPLPKLEDVTPTSEDK